jgi:hypothetical protein
MYGILKSSDGTMNNGGKARIANIIFETRIYNYFIGLEEIKQTVAEGDGDSSQFVHDGVTISETVVAYRDKA